MAEARLDGRVERGNRTRQLVLRRTVDIASVEGLEALSVGRLATELQLSKSGVFALFGSKQELQLATVREAARTRIYVEQVIRPASETRAGVARVGRLCELWLDYSQGRVFPGGCFFYEVIAEFDARPGPVHDPAGRGPGFAFAPPVDVPVGAAPLDEALRLLGRTPKKWPLPADDAREQRI
ncbi:TetR family transcriptional regulator [Streptomyces sp. NBC_01549]|uniref:TetR/AcrR family transcriptional regulator n=1 Tax=Streptomyces sp. NBC_01549 TaxID=2975874 RepID=UPI002251EA0D|nr:TetR family transcriptional regulator [Streptomyces sp. NBC_01549]MCX4588501.1 TetR family transcriptional regulator [Streptomyces sp. NBC_01549]